MKYLKTFEAFDPMIGVGVVAGAGVLIYLTKLLKAKLHGEEFDQIVDILDFVKSEKFNISEDEEGIVFKSKTNNPSVEITLNKKNNVLAVNVEDGGKPIIIRLTDEESNKIRNFI